MPIRHLVLAITPLAFLLAISSQASSQEWARKMFETTDHDFEVVARGSDTVFKFPVNNIYKEEVVLGSVRSSCGCTTASLEKPIIKTHSSGFVVAKFNTRTFTGLHSATLTVQIVKPYPAQVQVRVHGNIRGDVVFEPGKADFAQVDQGTPHEKRVAISFAGRAGWSIDDVRSENDHLEAKLIQRERSGRGRVIYDLMVRLRETAPAGYLKTQLVLITNDAANPRIPLEVAAEVRPEISIAPATLVLGDVPQGEVVTKRLLVRGKRPFRIIEATSVDTRFEAEYSDTPGTKQIVTLRFNSSGKPGRVRAPITFKTDLGETFTATCDAYATVTPTPSTAAGDGASTEETAEPADRSQTASVN